MKRIDAIKVLNWLRNKKYISNLEWVKILEIWQRERFIDEVKHGKT